MADLPNIRRTFGERIPLVWPQVDYKQVEMKLAEYYEGRADFFEDMRSMYRRGGWATLYEPYCHRYNVGPINVWLRHGLWLWVRWPEPGVQEITFTNQECEGWWDR